MGVTHWKIYHRIANHRWHPIVVKLGRHSRKQTRCVFARHRIQCDWSSGKRRKYHGNPISFLSFLDLPFELALGYWPVNIDFMRHLEITNSLKWDRPTHEKFYSIFSSKRSSTLIFSVSFRWPGCSSDANFFIPKSEQIYTNRFPLLFYSVAVLESEIFSRINVLREE